MDTNQFPSKWVVNKAKRRIKRFIKLNKPVARVRQIGENVFEYKVRHHVTSLFFRRDKLNRLRIINTTSEK